MLDELPISMITYLCFGCEKCKGAKEEVFVYVYTKRLFDRVYVFYNKTLYVFDVTAYMDHPNTPFSISGFNIIEHVKEAHNGVVSSRILSAAELLERMKACYMK